MPDVVIAGGGVNGLGAALFMARRGLQVVVVERDGPPAASNAEDLADHWQRPRAPQSYAQWMAAGQPIGDITTMSRIENRRRSIVDQHGPVVGGLVPLGDAALHTNPAVGCAVASVVHLLAPPAQAFADPEVAAAVAHHLATQPPPQRDPDEPNRADFAALAHS